jgi:transposase
VRTWSPKGKTPVLKHAFNWHQLSVIAAMTESRFYFRLFPGPIKGPQVIEFLKGLLRQVKRKLLIIWDGLPVHRSRCVQDYLRQLNGAIRIERLPSYAPELNPTEYVWGYLKQHELNNFCAADFSDLTVFARQRLQSMQRRQSLTKAFWKHAGMQI